MAHQPDSAVAKAASFTLHPEGQFAARCVDVINLGLTVIRHKQNPDEYLAEKIVLVFYCGEHDEQGKLLTVKNEFTLTMSDKGRLRPFLESWRGKKYDPSVAREGIDVAKLYGQLALITVGHEQVGDKTYANIVSCAQLPAAMAKGVPALDAIGYERDAYWAKKKATTEDDTKAWLAAKNKNKVQKFVGGIEVPEQQDGDDDLPF